MSVKGSSARATGAAAVAMMYSSHEGTQYHQPSGFRVAMCRTSGLRSSPWSNNSTESLPAETYHSFRLILTAPVTGSLRAKTALQSAFRLLFQGGCDSASKLRLTIFIGNLAPRKSALSVRIIGNVVSSGPDDARRPPRGVIAGPVGHPGSSAVTCGRRKIQPRLCSRRPTAGVHHLPSGCNRRPRCEP